MPGIIHDGAAIWAEMGPPAELAVGRLAQFLQSYFSATETDDEPLYGVDWWPENIGRLFDLMPRDERRMPDELRGHVLAQISRRASPPRRVLISHRQSDTDAARRLAGDIGAEGWSVWLDILDPDIAQVQGLQLPKRAESVLIALLIEMGLINSCAVIALITANSAGSEWIPYEYGRVRRGGPFAQMAAAGRKGSPLPDVQGYMRLGPVMDADSSDSFPDLPGWLLRL